MSEQQMPARIWYDYVNKGTMKRGPYVRSDIAERMAEALERCLSVFNSLADDGNYPKPLLNNGGWEFATKALSAFKDSAQ